MITKKTLDQLAAIAAEQEAAKTLPARRTKIVAKARAEGMSWREAAALLKMTEHGLIKAHQAAEKSGELKPSKPVKDSLPEPATELGE
jgi:transposase